MKDQLGIAQDRDGFAVVSGARPMSWPHTHEELELNLVLRGTAAYLLGDRRYDLRRDSLVWLFPEQEHFFLDVSPDYQAWLLVFRPQLLCHACRGTGSTILRDLDPPGQFCKSLTPDLTRDLAELFARVASEAEADSFNAGLAYALLRAWSAYQTAPDAPPGVAVHPAVERAVRLLQDEADAENVAALARRVGLSPSHLSRLFGQQIGLSLTDYRNGQRLERFLRALRPGVRVNLSRAALDAGFGSYAQFHTVFTRRMGCSPADYCRSLSSSPPSS